MTTRSFASLANGQHISFNPELDVLAFGTTGSAGALRRAAPGLGDADLRALLGARYPGTKAGTSL